MGLNKWAFGTPSTRRRRRILHRTRLERSRRALRQLPACQVLEKTAEDLQDPLLPADWDNLSPSSTAKSSLAACPETAPVSGRSLADDLDPFDALLRWLDPDRHKGGQKYETIRAGLIRIFVSKGFSDAEDLADETIDRVTHRLPDIVTTYVGEPGKYFHGVARNVIFERNRRKEIATEITPARFDPLPFQSDLSECLERCLHRLPRDKSDLILDYYLYEGHEKIEHHKKMAQNLAISDGALRCRAHQIRSKLEECVRQCMKTKTETERASKHIVDSGVLEASNHNSRKKQSVGGLPSR